MRILAIGDIHGRGVWEAIIEKEKADVIVFIGDYLDSFDVGIWEQIENMQRIFKLAEEDSRVHLLIGNHDYHYTRYAGTDRYSGFQLPVFVHVQEQMSHALRSGFLKTVFREGDLLFSHAGVTKTWMKSCGLGSVDAINTYVQHNPHALRFVGRDSYGDSIESGPTWVRPESLKKDKLDGYTQIVGHTSLGGIVDQNGVFFIDALNKEWYLTIEDGVFEKIKL